MRALLLVAVALPAWAGTVVLKGEAETAGPYVTLGEVAEISGDPLWSKVYLGESPVTGETRTLERGAVQARLDYLGIEARVEGAEQVRLRPAAAGIGERRHMEEVVRAELDVRIRAYPTGGPACWRLSADPVSLPQAWTSARVLEASEPSRDGAVRVRLRGNGEEIELGVRAERVRSVVVAARSLRTHQRIGSGDVAFRELPERELPPGVVVRAEGCLGCLVLSSVAPEGILLDSNLAAPRLVVRGSVCLLEERAGSVRIRCQAKALTDGKLGEVIPFEVLDSGKVVRGRVAAAGEADLGLGEDGR